MKCWRCRGDGFFWRVPNGFNPFYAGAMATAAASRKVDCFECKRTGVVIAKVEADKPEMQTTDKP